MLTKNDEVAIQNSKSQLHCMIIKKLAARVHKTDENHKVYMVFVISFLCLITSHIKQSNKNLIFKIHLPLSVLAKKKAQEGVFDQQQFCKAWPSNGILHHSTYQDVNIYAYTSSYILTGGGIVEDCSNLQVVLNYCNLDPQTHKTDRKVENGLAGVVLMRSNRKTKPHEHDSDSERICTAPSFLLQCTVTNQDPSSINRKREEKRESEG